MADKPDPYDIEALESAVNDSASRVSTIWISFLVFSLYLLTAATTVTHRQLFLAEPLKLPVLNIDLPLWGFFFLAPILFVILHIYVLLQVLLLGRTTAAYNDAVARLELSPEENTSLRQRLANTLFAQIFAGSPREREGFIGLLLRAMVWITLAIAPILIVLAFQFSFLAYHSHIATWTHRLLILVELAAFFLVWPLALDAQKDFQWPKVGADLKHLAMVTWRLLGPKEQRRSEWQWLRQQAAPLAVCLLFIIVSLSIATFPGEPHVDLITGHSPFSVQCKRWVHRQFGIAHLNIDLRFDRLLLPYVHVVEEDKLAAIEKHTSERNLQPWEGERTRDFRDRDLSCSDLSSVDLRRVDLEDARLIGAELDFAALEGALLQHAQLQSASLSGAKLQGALLTLARLQGTNLNYAELQGASLGNAQMQGANLISAQMQGARLDYAQLQGANLGLAQLQGASLENAQLQGADLGVTRLQGAYLGGAQLQGADLAQAQLQGAHFALAILDHSVLSGIWTWHARDAACTGGRIIDHKPDQVVDIDTSLFSAHKPIPATPDAIAKFIETSVGEIPNASRKEDVVMLMHIGLDVDPLERSTDDAIEKMWSDCEEETHKIPQEKFDGEHATILRNVVCDATESRAAIAQGIVDIWIVDSNERRAFSVQLAQGLLNQDGRWCAAIVDFNEETKKKLRAAAAMAVPAAALAK